MIEVNKNKVEISGSLFEIQAELCLAIKTIYKNIAQKEDEKFAKEIIMNTVNTSFMTAEEVHKKNEELVKEILKKIFCGEGEEENE